MHYPRRGLPPAEATRAAPLALDRRCGPLLERHLARRAGEPDAEARAALAGCGAELERLGDGLELDAARYFGRLRQLIALVAAEALAVDQALIAAGEHGAERLRYEQVCITPSSGRRSLDSEPRRATRRPGFGRSGP